MNKGQMIRYFARSFFLLAILTLVVVRRQNFEDSHNLLRLTSSRWFFTHAEVDDDDIIGTRSKGYMKYTHQVSQRAISQHDAELLYFWTKLVNAPEGSSKRMEAQKQMVEALSYRMHVDHSISLVGKLLLGITKGPEVLHTQRPAGQPVVDDWHCLRQLVRAFETNCGSLTQYGMKHMLSIGNLCNAGITKEQMAEASAQACPSIPSGVRSYLQGLSDGAT